MNYDISFSTPIYLFLLGFIFSVLISYFLYLYHPKTELVKSKLYLLFALRSLSFALIFFLLSKPVVEIMKQKSHPATIAVGVDNSRSVAMLNKDKFLGSKIKKLITLLKDNFSAQQVETYTFGSSPTLGDSLDFSENRSDLSAAIRFGEENFAHRNLQAIVLISDGISNFGQNPVYLSENAKLPIFTVSSFTQVSGIDLKIDKLVYNETAYKGTQSSIRIKIKAQNIKAKSFVLSVKKNSSLIFSRKLQISTLNSNFEVKIPVKFKKRALVKFHISLTHLADEISYDNNEATIAIKVLAKKQQILILASAPHPDVAALKHALEANSNFEVKTSLLSRLNKKVTADLIIFHQLPDNNTKLWHKFLKTNNIDKIPTIFILGKRSQFQLFNKLQKGLQLRIKRNQFDPSSVVFNPTQTSFEFDTEFLNLLKNVPPLETPYAKYRLSVDAQILFYRQYKNILTNEPVVVYSPENKSIIFTASGIWNWRISDYRKNLATTFFDEFANNIVMKLLQEGNKSNELEYKPVLYLGEMAHFIYFHRDTDLKLSDLPKLKINRMSTVYNFRSLSPFKYVLDISGLELGDYPFIFESRFKNGSKYRENGKLSVLKNRLESKNLSPNIADLQKIAFRSKGSYLPWFNRNALVDSIRRRVSFKSLETTSLSVDDFILYKWLFFVIFFILVVEWAIRKFLSLD